MKPFAKKAYESLLLELYPDSPLPLSWQVIYQEAIRGNHLLFSGADQRFHVGRTPGDLTLDLQEHADELVGVFSHLVRFTSVAEAKKFIGSQAPKLRSLMFILYTQFVEQWKYSVRSSMN